ATGVYGRSVVERLHRAGHDVVAMARRPPKSLPPGVRFVAGDVRDLPAVQAAMDGCEVVAHLAFVVTPMKDREASRAISVGGTRNIVEAMRRTGARRLVFASSAMTYGANPDNPPLFTEEHDQRPAPDYVYGTDKVAAERVIIDSGVEAVLARTGVTVGRNLLPAPHGHRPPPHRVGLRVRLEHGRRCGRPPAGRHRPHRAGQTAHRAALAAALPDPAARRRRPRRGHRPARRPPPGRRARHAGAAQ